eukprot:SAG22_NODE_1123_length_5488_cov_53.464465_8_plen_67_part_00
MARSALLLAAGLAAASLAPSPATGEGGSRGGGSEAEAWAASLTDEFERVRQQLLRPSPTCTTRPTG